jgi:hypothetical protein
MTSNSNFKNFDFQKKKDKSNNNNSRNNNDIFKDNNFNNKYNNKYKNKYQNKFLNKKETEEEKLEREYQRRKFRESILAYDWSKTVPLVKNATQKELRRKKNDDKRKVEYKTLSTALKSTSLTKKEKIDFLKKKISFLRVDRISSKIKESKIINIFKLRTKKTNQAIQYLFSRFSILNYNKLFKKRKKSLTLYSYKNFYFFLKKLSINDIISLKEKINKINNNIIIQNINLFYFKEIFSFFSLSLLKNKIIDKKYFLFLFNYLNSKYKKNIIRKYYNLLDDIKEKKYISFFSKLKIENNNYYPVFDILKLYPLSYSLEGQSSYFFSNKFKKAWRKFYLNKSIFRIFLKNKISKKKIRRYGLKKKRYRKNRFSSLHIKSYYFRKKFSLLNRKLKVGPYDDNREMTPSEISHNNSLKQALKKSVNKKDKKEMLLLVFKMKYPRSSNSKINLLLSNHLKKKAKLLKKFKKYKKKKVTKVFFKLKNLGNKLFFFNKKKLGKNKKLFFVEKKKNVNSINRSEFILNRKLDSKLRKSRKRFTFLKKKSKYSSNFYYFLKKRYLEKKGIKYNVYAYKKIKINKSRIKLSKPKIRFKKKIDKYLFFKYINSKKKYRYLLRKLTIFNLKKFRLKYLRKLKRNISFFSNLKRYYRTKKYLISSTYGDFNRNLIGQGRVKKNIKRKKIKKLINKRKVLFRNQKNLIKNNTYSKKIKNYYNISKRDFFYLIKKKIFF